MGNMSKYPKQKSLVLKYQRNLRHAWKTQIDSHSHFLYQTNTGFLAATTIKINYAFLTNFRKSKRI
jgi:hypothetical protein